jgi:Xaa-Pro aminopeptidase
VVAEGLVELGVLRGSPETLLESGAATLFFPHGVGHLVGLGVRDTGPASNEAREPVPGLPRLRIDIPLRPRQAWTVEPGIYVVPALSPGNAAATASTGIAPTTCTASAACASSRTC